MSDFAARPVPLDSSQLELLHANGLRLVAVPLESLPDLQSRLSVIGANQRKWVGQAPSWLEAVPGPIRPNGQTIAMHDGPLRLGPGRMRLLVRCWTVPVASADGGAPKAALHLEIIPQHQESNPAKPPGLQLAPVTPPVEEQGLLFARLHLKFDLPEGEAYLLVPEVPAATWTRLDPGGSPPEAAPVSPNAAPPKAASTDIGSVGQVVRGDTPPPASDRAESAQTTSRASRTESTYGPAASNQPGPPSRPLPTLGQAMLMSEVANPEPRTVRAVVLLIPRVPKTFELLR